MPGYNQERRRPARRTGIPVAVAMMAIILSGCVTDTSNLLPSPDVAAKFKNYEMIPDYSYYHYSVGFFRRTYAIIGLGPPYSVDSNLWRRIDANEGLKPFVDNAIWVTNDAPRGFVVTNPQGLEVGVWYSSIFGSSVRFTDDNRVVPLVHEPFKGRDGGGR